MRKNIYLILTLQFFLINSAYARCNFEAFGFGSSYEQVRGKFPEDMPMMSASSPTLLFVPGEWVCKNEKVFEGSPVFFHFVEDKLVRIQIFRYTMQGGVPSLIKWAESIYGVIKKPKSFFNIRPSADWSWKDVNTSIRYVVESDESGFAEGMFIDSKAHSALIMEQSGQLESNNN